MSKKIPVEVSARHIHISEEDLKILFGDGYTLTVKKELSQPGEYVCEERVNIVGPRRNLDNVSILGPVRKQTQVEISLTDARSIGLTVPVRESGDLAGSAGCRLIGPKGELELTEGVIAAKRHIHLTIADAEQLKVENKQIVGFSVKTDDRSLIFDDVVVRVSDTYARAMHIDTDEGNAAGVSTESFGRIVF
ncbi:MAG: phosphate propanoyltransferase [Oscillospiraceae bacterium]|nr:phosphate propanoyltransferase [Oscillospiraceae bacterium]